jgi:hypothetical protein
LEKSCPTAEFALTVLGLLIFLQEFKQTSENKHTKKHWEMHVLKELNLNFEQTKSKKAENAEKCT